ncbi:hypothetical protein KR018_003210, partial [Drosophila ironensis]
KMVLITLTLCIAAVGLLYLVMTWNFDYWRKRRVPGPKPKIVTGNYPNMFSMKRNVIYDINDIYNKYKSKYDAVGIFGGRIPQLLVINPQLVRRVFVSDFRHFHDNEVAKYVDEKTDFIFANNLFSLTGRKWKQWRAEITPGLTMGRLKTMYPVTNTVCQKLSEWITKQVGLETTGKNGIDAKEMSLRFTSEMVTDVVLGLSAGSFSDNPIPIVTHVNDLFKQPWAFKLFFVVTSTFPALSHLLKLRFVPKHVEKLFIELMTRAVEARRAQLAADKEFERSDFLEYIMQLADKRDLNIRQLLARTMTFMLDGFETTAIALAHMLLLLGRDQEAQQRLREEILPRLKNGVVAFDELNSLPYLDACLQEAIRIFPPSFMSSKLCTENIELTNKDGPNFVVEKGIAVVVPNYCFMQDEEYFADSKAFQPERFIEPDAAKNYRGQGVFLGFGDGPRICIGMRFATAQIKAAIVELITKFNVRVNPKTRKDNELEPTGIVTSLRGGIWLDMELRQ